MKKNYCLPSLKITSELKEKIDKAILKLNAETNAEINQATFRRIALKLLSNSILSNELKGIEFLRNKD